MSITYKEKKISITASRVTLARKIVFGEKSRKMIDD